MVDAAMPNAELPTLSHNLLGQRLGRKGRGTRERILAATDRLLAAPRDIPFSLSAVAREASLGMTTLYLYFSDMTELLLAALEPIMASAEECYLAQLRTRWPDAELAAHCHAFVQAFHDFWLRHTRILHMRNSLAEGNDARMGRHRIQGSEPLVLLLAHQMDADPAERRSASHATATVLLTGLERMVTIATDATFAELAIGNPADHARNLLKAEARVLELCIRDRREAAAQSPKAK